MTHKIKYIKALIILTGITTLSGCATTNYGTPVDNNLVTIETHRSRVADIGQVNVYKQTDGYLIRGKVRRNSYSRGRISGHVDIELVNSKGTVIHSDSTSYTHSAARFSSKDFSLKINQPIEQGSLLRITHKEPIHHDGHKNTKSGD